MHKSLFLLALLPVVCTGQFHQVPAKSDPTFSPEQFFVGKTEGSGTTKVIFSSPQTATVHGVGRVDLDGVIVLDQTVARTGAKTKHREWRLKQI